MSTNRLAFLIMLHLLLCSCSKCPDCMSVTRWGKENFYKDFLWKKYTPDTLYREMKFEFNDDARNYMESSLQLGVFKKSGNGNMLPVMENEMSVFVDGKKCADNIICVVPGTERIRVGFVFNPAAENKVHHWFLKTIDDGGLDRINDMDADTFNSPESSLLDVEVEKRQIMNPLRKGLLIMVTLLLVLLVLWLMVLKLIFFPTFKVGRIILSDPVPYMCQKSLRGSRKLILTKDRPSQGMLNRFFTGKIIYDVNQMWTTDIVIEPRDRNSVRVRIPKEYMADARVMKTHNEYTISNIATGTKTKLKIS